LCGSYCTLLKNDFKSPETLSKKKEKKGFPKRTPAQIGNFSVDIAILA